MHTVQVITIFILGVVEGFILNDWARDKRQLKEMARRIWPTEKSKK